MVKKNYCPIDQNELRLKEGNYFCTYCQAIYRSRNLDPFALRKQAQAYISDLKAEMEVKIARLEKILEMAKKNGI